jgi:hypothetical protein
MVQEPVQIAVKMTLQSPPPTKTLLPENSFNIGCLQIHQKYQKKVGEVRTADPTHLHSKDFERAGEKSLKMVDKQRSLQHPQSFSVRLDSSLPHRQILQLS